MPAMYSNNPEEQGKLVDMLYYFGNGALVATGVLAGVAVNALVIERKPVKAAVAGAAATVAGKLAAHAVNSHEGEAMQYARMGERAQQASSGIMTVSVVDTL